MFRRVSQQGSGGSGFEVSQFRNILPSFGHRKAEIRWTRSPTARYDHVPWLPGAEPELPVRLLFECCSATVGMFQSQGWREADSYLRQDLSHEGHRREECQRRREEETRTLWAIFMQESNEKSVRLSRSRSNHVNDNSALGEM